MTAGMIPAGPTWQSMKDKNMGRPADKVAQRAGL